MVFFFFFKQKTAYEMLRSLVGSEMCIRDSNQYVYKSMRYVSVDRKIGAGEGIRTLDPNLGKVVLYH